MNRSFSTLFVIAASYAVPMALMARQADPALVSEFLSEARERLPTDGGWHAVFQPGGVGEYGHVEIAYDWETRRWSMVSQVAALGVGTDGVAFMVSSSGLGAPVTIHDAISTLGPAVPPPSNPLDELFPTLVVRDLCERERAFRSLRRLESGGWLVGMIQPDVASPPTPSDDPLAGMGIELEMDSLGRLVRREQGQGRWHLRWEFEYDQRSSPGFFVPARVTRTAVSSGATSSRLLVALDDFGLGSHEAMFRPEQARARAASAGRAGRVVATAMALHADHTYAAAHPLGDDSDHPAPIRQSGLAPASTRPSPNQLSRYSTPMVLAGLVVAAIGVLAWWRRALR